MRPLVLALISLAVLLPGAAVGAAGYNAAACRAAATGWANDPCAGRQWSLTAIRAPQAWRTVRGGGVIVAVVDTGVDLSHPDLRGRLLVRPGSDLIRNTASRCPFQRPLRPRGSAAVARDENGHGTHVAGIVAAATANRRGIAGVAPAARVLPVKVLDRTGAGTDRAVARGICFAVRNGAKVINLSIGHDPITSVTVSGSGADTNRAVSFAHARGVAVIIAAGNESFPSCDFPASHAKALCVGAVDRRGLRARYSNFGTAVGVVAPGGAGALTECAADDDVWSTILPRAERDCGQDGYEPLAGTSMAAPHVAGVAALIAARFPRRATPDFIYDRLKTTADDLGVPGVDPFHGYGRVNAQRAVRR